VLVIAVRDERGTFIYNPGPDYHVRAGTVLIILGETGDVKKLRSRMESYVGQFADSDGVSRL